MLIFLTWTLIPFLRTIFLFFFLFANRIVVSIGKILPQQNRTSRNLLNFVGALDRRHDVTATYLWPSVPAGTTMTAGDTNECGEDTGAKGQKKKKNAIIKIKNLKTFSITILYVFDRIVFIPDPCGPSKFKKWNSQGCRLYGPWF